MTQPPAPAPAPAPSPTNAPPAPAPAPAPADLGFPANTPVVQMTVEQQAAYWKHYARQHEDRAKQFGDLTPEQLTELREAKKRQDALELELGTTAEKAAAKAAEEAVTKTRGEFQPQLITAKLEAAAARAGVTDEDLTKAVAFVDTGKFLKADGTIDAAKVSEFVATIAPTPGTGTPPQQTPRGPLVTPHVPAGTAPVKPGDGARAALAARGIKIDG